MSDISALTSQSSTTDGASALSGLKTAVGNVNTDKVEGQSSSVDSEVALFSGTGGKTIKRASATGIAKLASGVLSAVTAPSGAIVGDTDSQTLTNKTISGASNTLTVREADLSISDNTTKNVSTSAHGFVPKAPNDTSKFLRGDGTWAAGSNPVYKHGIATRDASTASGSQTIAHGCGATPKYIRLTAIYL